MENADTPLLHGSTNDPDKLITKLTMAVKDLDEKAKKGVTETVRGLLSMTGQSVSSVMRMLDAIVLHATTPLLVPDEHDHETLEDEEGNVILVGALRRRDLHEEFESGRGRVLERNNVPLGTHVFTYIGTDGAPKSSQVVISRRGGKQAELDWDAPSAA